MGKLDGLQPERVFYYFEEISNIPRGSGNEKAVSDYCVQFAKDHNLAYIQDQENNVIIKKPAYAGYETHPGVVLQGHLDMVCEKNNDKNHDFLRQGIPLVVDGDWIKADGTTLGADNGVAIAYSLAILEDKNLKHPPLEAVFTTNEEVGMDGAAGLSPDCILGRRIINLDSGNEQGFLVSCAGGVKPVISFPIQWETSNPGYIAAELSIKGLKGGHSGIDIIKQRVNANKLLFRILNRLSKEVVIQVSEVTGGAKDNAIPREASAKLWLQNMEQAQPIVRELALAVQKEYAISDPEIQVALNPCSLDTNKVFSDATLRQVAAYVLAAPNGVQSMSLDMENLVESSANLGVVRTSEQEIRITCSIRSSVESKKQEIVEQVQALAGICGGTVQVIGNYPGWAFDKDSKLLKICQGVYEKVFHKEPLVEAIHGGLECGLLSGKFPGSELIAFGPDMWDVHSPDERLSVSSTERVYQFLLKVLEELCLQ